MTMLSMRRLRSRGPGVAGLAKQIDAEPGTRGRELRRRLSLLVQTLGGSDVGQTIDHLERLEVELAHGDAQVMWLTLAVLLGQFPIESSLRRACRMAELDGPLAVVAAVMADRKDLEREHPNALRHHLDIVTNQVVVDLHHTSGAKFNTGIQRVAREVVRRWAETHDIVLVGWKSGYTALYRLPESIAWETKGDVGLDDESVAPEGSIIVPWRSTYVLPELLGEAGRVDRFQCLAHFSGNRSSVIGFDCVPMTTGETAIVGMGADFAHYLSAVARTDRVATISEASAVEFRGWRAMLKGAGIEGPEIRAILLPADKPTLNDEALAIVRDQLAVVGMPMVLVVGSHEPRKNHRAVLHAAEMLWREGLSFSLLFVGGNSWNSERFTHNLHQLQAEGRPVHAVRALTDELLWAAYAVARCTVFPSINEGFGLPVAESLASGTPAITSNFGSMREIAEAGGALLVDPRDDHDIAAALKRMLTDDALHASLARQARERPARSWEDYARETWNYFVDPSLR